MKLVLAAAVAVLASSSFALACKHEPAITPAVTTGPSPTPAAPSQESAAPAPPTTGTAHAAELPPETSEAADTSASAAPPDPRACLEVDSTFGGKRAVLSGTIYVDRQFAHPARGKTHPFILRLDSPRCVVAGGKEEPKAVEVHLAPTDGVSLEDLVGKHVRVSGEPFAAHTAWHARGVVVLTGNVAITRG